MQEEQNRDDNSEAGLAPQEIAERRIEKFKAEMAATDNSLAFLRVAMLHLSGLALERLPDSLRDLRGLQTLFVSNASLKELPPWIGEFKGLRVLDLSNNQLESLPEEMGALSGMFGLYLSDNRLASLPETLRDFKAKHLLLGGNPDLGLPDALSALSPMEEFARTEALLRYYFESRGDQGRPLREMKLLLVGRGQAGKTTLAKRLAGLKPSRREKETHSIAICPLKIFCGGEFVTARLWDFGGQEILHATHQFFLTDRSLYVVVLEPRSGTAQRNAEYWLRLIETRGGGSPTLVVLNWSHERLWNVDEVKLRRTFPFIIGFFRTDALYGDGIADLREAIEQAVVDRMPEVWKPFPQRWRGIKDGVAGMKKNFLGYAEYTGLCVRWGETDPAAQADLAGVLHALGLALWYGNDPRLHDTRVLNPGWVTGGVYAVIRSPTVAGREGLLAPEDMPAIFKEAQAQKVVKARDYPRDTHRFILDLMCAFELAYASEEKDGRPVRYLVPELLPEFELAMDENWDEAPLRLRYRYELLPPGLLPRFIVRTHALSDGAPHWRHGVVLRHAEALALIRAETDRPELYVFVLGGDAETRRLLAAMVRRELDSLHADLKMRPVEELALTGEAERWIEVEALQEFDDPARPTQKLAVQPRGTAEVNVQDELDKLLPAAARAVDRNPSAAPPKVRLFVSYAHDDERKLKPLDAVLGALELFHDLEPWRDRRLVAGDAWEREIRHRLDEMDVFLFVGSQQSVVSGFIRDVELARARQRHEAGEVEIVTLKLEPCASDDDPWLGGFQRLAPRLASIAETDPRSRAWEQVRKDLLPVIARVREKKTGAGGR
jgi:internalin A